MKDWKNAKKGIVVMNRKFVSILTLLFAVALCVSITSCDRNQKTLATVVSPTEEIPEPPAETIPEPVPEPVNGLLAEVYIPGGWLESLPDFDTITPVQTLTTANIDFPLRNSDIGFIELGIDPREHFAIRFRGKLMVENPGIHIFKIQSDDGAQVYVNGDLIVDNDGLQAWTTAQGRTTLTAGLHDVEVRYFQWAIGMGVQWYWWPPDSPEQIVPPEVLYAPDIK